MATISIDAAVDKLISAVEEMRADDLVQAYNELFPDEPATEEEAYEDVTPLMKRIVDRMRHGLEPEEAVDLWNVVFPAGRDVYFDEEDNVLHFEAAGVAE